MKKLLPSPSISSTFDARVCNPRAAATTPNCLSGILRRILCSGSLPTHPSDHITKENNSVKSEDKLSQVKDVSHVIKATNVTKPNAGIVARLMGLDPMLEMNSIATTQSINSVEHFYKHLECNHRGVRSKVSIGNIPTFLELENEDYFILSFEGETKTKQLRSKQLRTKKREQEEDKCINRGTNKTEIKLESESSSSSEDLISPVSVLRDPTQLSGDTSSKFPLELDDGLINKEGNSTKKKVIYNGVQQQRFKEAMTEIDLSGSNWKFSQICEELGVGGIIEGFDSYILEGLIEEFVEQMYDSIFF